jgi:TonB family protein
MIADSMYTLALSTLTSSAAIVLILVLRKPLRRHFGARSAYAVWMLVPIAAAAVLLPAPVSSIAPVMNFANTAPVAVQALPLAAPVATAFDPVPWLGAIWLFGVLTCAALFVRQQRRFVRTLGKLAPAGDRTFIAQTASACPALVGAWRPRIVLPADFNDLYDCAQRELVIAHESVHRRRGDAQLNALATVLRCVYWFNPLMHFAASRFRFDQELACDAVVIECFPQARRPYADAMLKTQLAVLGLPVGCHWQSSHPLKERIAMLKQAMPGRARRMLGISCVAAIVLAASVAAWAVQPARMSASKSIDAGTIGDGEIILSFEGMSADAELLRAETKSMTVLTGDTVHTPKLADLEFGLAVTEPFILEIGRAGQVWKLDGRVKKVSGADYQIDTELAFNGNVVGHPSVKVADAQPAAIKAGDDKNGGADGMRVQFDFRKAQRAATAVRPAESGSSKALNMTHSSKTSAPESSEVSAPPAMKAVTYRKLMPPKYPPAAINQGMEGTVFVKVRVGKDGEVLDAKVDRVDPPSAVALGEAAVDAVKSWRFNAATAAGVPVVGEVIVPFQFEIDGDGSPKTRHQTPEIPGALGTILVTWMKH